MIVQWTYVGLSTQVTRIDLLARGGLCEILLGIMATRLKLLLNLNAHVGFCAVVTQIKMRNLIWR